MKMNIRENEKQRLKTIKIPNKIRLAIVGILALIILFSLISLANAYQKSTIKQIEFSKLEYNQVGNYNYIAYINESIVYEGKETLRPGEGIIFRGITKNIDASFIYRLITNKNSTISGTYTITAQIMTDIWNKTYTIVSETPFNSNGTYATFTEQFPINYLFYENITDQIEEEIGVTANNPTLIIQTDIVLILNVDGEIVYETLSPSLSVKLGEPKILIEFGADNQANGEGNPIIEKVTNQDVIEERNTWTMYSSIFLLIMIISIIFTRGSEKLTKTEKENKKIMKKYKEWIVEIQKEPKKKNINIIQINSIEDLIKVSEELGKPVFHYLTENNSHQYYVLDGKITYEYKLQIQENEEKTKIAICPYCQTKIEVKGIRGEKVHLKCPNCEKEGETKI
jgi:hypothetical protein